MGLPALKFDTLSFAKALKDAGVNEKQAEVYAEKQAEIIQMLQNEQLVTKDDIHRLELEIVKAQQGIKAVEEKLTHISQTLEMKIQGLSNSLLMKIGALVIASVALLHGLHNFI